LDTLNAAAADPAGDAALNQMESTHRLPPARLGDIVTRQPQGRCGDVEPVGACMMGTDTDPSFI
jgi:hypothetical protein